MKNNEKRNSLPSLTMNKFFVNKRASMFEKVEEAPPPGKRDWREWSPCGLVESSQKKLEGAAVMVEEGHCKCCLVWCVAPPPSSMHAPCVIDLEPIEQR